MASLVAWHWGLIALGIALVASSIVGIFWWYHRQRRREQQQEQQKQDEEIGEAAGKTKQVTAVIKESSSISSEFDDRPGPTLTTTTTPSDTNSITVVDIEKLDHQLALMPLSPRRQQKGKNIAIVANGSSSGGGDESKFGALVQQHVDGDESHRRVLLSPFLAGVGSPQLSPIPPSCHDTNSSCSTAQSMLPKPVISSCLNVTWRGPTPPWTMPIE